MPQEVQAETRVAHEDEMRARVGECEHAGFVFEQRRNAGIVVLEQLGDQRGIDRQIEEPVERIAPGRARKVGHGFFVHFDFRPVAVEQDARLRVGEIFAEAVAKRRIGVDVGQFFRMRRFHAVKGVVRKHEVRIAQREIEGQRMRVGVDVNFVAASAGRRAAFVVAHRHVRRGVVVHGEHGHHERGTAGTCSKRFHEFRGSARSGRHHENAAFCFAQRLRQRAQLGFGCDSRRHRTTAESGVIGRK